MLCFGISSDCYSQRDPKYILDHLGNSAQSFFLSANRPGFDVSAYTPSKGKHEFDLSLSFNKDIVDFPISYEYGISSRTALLAGITAFTQSYRFNGQKVSGLGDANIGVKYQFHRSEYFYHAFQVITKIPTASTKNELGTGKFDFHLGIAQSFFKSIWGYDLDLQLSLLHRRDLPTTRNQTINGSIDSISKAYNYKFEPEISVSFTPNIEVNKYISFYAGISFTRNTKLDYNTSQFYTGTGISLSDKTGLGLGAAFGILNSSSWLLSAGINFIL